MISKKKLIRIAITGPESTGKSELAQGLAKYYNTMWVPEYAREYLNNLERPYEYEDILTIAKGQVKGEKEMRTQAGRFLFADTEMLVLKIWCDVKYGKCHPWILDKLEKQNYDLYLLTDIDLPWQPDPLREHPDMRKELFDLYLGELEKRKLPFEIVRGLGQQRLKDAVGKIEKRIKIKGENF
jgi:NadR type nicotinamide-nucleotide adenylyltransferase